MTRGVQEFIGQTAQATAVSESGLYKLILRANPSRPEVAKFQDWVTREVLPAIRKTGAGRALNMP
jgi:prophage antirepressor-like protein